MPSLICRLSVRAFSPSRVRRLALLASACALALAPGRGLALSLSQENFEQASDGTNYVVLGEHGLGDPFIDEYFKRGTNGDFSMGLTLLNLHGTNFWAGEDTDFDGPGECRVTVRALDVRGFQNLRATWALAIGRDAAYGGTPFESSDYMILQTALDGSAWTNVSVFRGPASSGYLREDTNKDGIGDGTQLTRTFQDFQANVSGLGTGLQVRVILYMNSPDEEAAFDDIRVTGDPIPPIITITNPAQDLAVTESVSTYTVQGTANLGVVELIAWTNSLTGLQGTIPAATNWSIPGISLGVGVNTITVSGSNTVGQVNSKNVSINRVLPPTLSITVPPSTLNVPDTTTALNLAGVANTYVAGSLRWTNALTGATGSVPAATNWTITGVGLALGTNVITVTGTNIVQQSASAAVSVYRVPLPALAITSPTSGVAVAHDVTTITVSGTASAEAFGLLRWTNSL
ncbi:MAG: hypothetical protein K8T26_15550, partial [Lentisphaerae bacterium]|nr:hypothetical protein [Lentisphaerota bacterium]